MKCCICGMEYEEHDRVIKYFTYLDRNSLELKTANRIDIHGKTAALCANCTRAAAFGIVSCRKDERYEPYKPLLWAPMFEEEQAVVGA